MLLVAGNLVYDWVAGPVTELAWDQTTWPAEFSAGLGGNGGTTAYAAARQGARVRLVTGRGEDEHGLILDRRLREAGVETVYLPGLAGGTAMTMGLFRPDGARALIHRPGVLTELFAAVPSLQPYGSGIRWLHVANPFAVPGLRRRAADYLREAKEAGWTTSMDLGWDRLGEWMQVVGPCLPHCDWLLANAAERAEVDLRGFAGGVVVKLGADGCTVGEVHIPGIPSRAVDSTGAGDCFCGGFLAAMLAGASPQEAAHAANACGARSVSAAGPTSGLD
ncbi:MAG TPA: carbohydrate kinase family protein [Bryobacteraceae bacterium]|nr:carbohydrate kinase family protein [Bryobacteraceae bacterium]